MKLGVTLCGTAVRCLMTATTRADGFDDLMHRAMAKAHIPGASVAAIRDGKIVRMSAYGVASREYSVAVTSQTPFQIASAGTITFDANGKIEGFDSGGD